MNNPIIFYLLGLKGFEVLKVVLETYEANSIKEVIIGNDQGVDNDYSLEIAEVCTINKINFKYRVADKGLDDTTAIAIGWRWIIDLNRIPNLIILHDSLLPKYRGFNPLVSALINKEEKVGVTALFASELYDRGNIIYQSETHFTYPIKIQKAIELISTSYIEVVIKILADIKNDRLLPSFKQDESIATYSLWRDDKDYHIDWDDANDRILRFIDAVGTPYGGALSYVNSELVIINEAELVTDLVIENRSSGKVIFIEKEFPIVVCGKGLLKIIEMVDYKSGERFKLKTIRTRFS